MKPVISVESLSKRYLIGHQRQNTHQTLRDVLAQGVARFGKRLVHPFRSSTGQPLMGVDEVEEFWALKDVSFEIKQGERVGIIGRNGAGKSTLLKILSRITQPTSGKIHIRGRVASLLEVGTGFHPELSGRENIFLNGAILGMGKAEIKKKFDEIVAFSGVEKFLDTPVKRYSSGMYVRLAFAVAAHLEPEILIVDEVLAVGDAQFQKKCLGKMEEVGKEGRTVLFVSHNMGAIGKLCSSVLWLDAGRVEAQGESGDIIGKYLASTFVKSAFKEFPIVETKIGQILRVRLLNEEGREASEFPCSSEPVLEVGFVLRQNIKGCHVACVLSTAEGVHVFSTADTDTDESLFEERAAGDYVVQVKLPTRGLNVGTYQVAVGLGEPGGAFDRQEAVSFSIHDVGGFGTMKEGAQRAGLLLVEAPWTYVGSNK